MKITENIVANLLCYLLDNYENQPLDERKLQEIGQEFLQSKYNKSNALEDDLEGRVERWLRIHRLSDVCRSSFVQGVELMEILSAKVEALDANNKTLKAMLESAQEDGKKMFNWFKELTEEEKALKAEKNRRKKINKNISKLASENDEQNNFELFQCNSHFKGGEKASQNRAHLKKWEEKTEELENVTCRLIELTTKSLLNYTAIDFYERHTFKGDIKWKE